MIRVFPVYWGTYPGPGPGLVPALSSQEGSLGAGDVLPGGALRVVLEKCMSAEEKAQLCESLASSQVMLLLKSVYLEGKHPLT